MEPQSETATTDKFELDRLAWNLPRPMKRPQTSQLPFSVQSEREDESEAETEAA